ncbi:MAG: PepSY domain-containing protein [Pseudomonadota bacterium]|nr:PepSY domain-containing protein [Pseudomonadota bacterium]
MRRTALLLAAALLLPSTGMAQSWTLPIEILSPNSLGAGWRPDAQNQARDYARRGQIVPLGRVLRDLQRRTPGRLLDAGLEQQDGRTVYRVRWVTADGRRLDYIVDAGTGAVLRAEGG